MGRADGRSLENTRHVFDIFEGAELRLRLNIGCLIHHLAHILFHSKILVPVAMLTLYKN